MQTQIDKKKRTSTSGSRSKSKKSTYNIRPNQTVQLKPKPLHIFHNQDISNKIKTQNSLSVNKSKGSKKNSKSLKRPQKTSIKQSQSYLVSAQRKFSVNKINKTQATHLQSQDIFKKLYLIKKQLSKLHVPEGFSISQIESYFNQIKQSFSNISLQPLQSIFIKLHNMYITPIQNLFDMIRPYESILRRKQQISQMIKQQIQENKKLYQQLDPQDIQIIKLKQKIQKHAQLIEEMKKKKKLQHNQFSMKKKKSPQNNIHPAKFIDLSNQMESSEDKINHEQFERKLGKQYEKNPVFHEQKKINQVKNMKQKQISNNLTQNIKTNNQQNSHQKDSNRITFQEQQRQQFHQTQSQKNSKISEQNLQDQYLQTQTFGGKQQNRQPQEQVNKMGIKSGGMSFSFKLDIPKIDRSNVGFHDQFYSKLDQFSQSWRNQALKQKRF